MNAKSNPRKIRKIVVHCTSTPEGRDIDAATVRSWHVNGNKWADIGYHWLIKLDGTIEKGRPENKAGAHVSGHNSDSIGIVYVGGVAKDGRTPKDTRTPEQKEALIRLLRQKRADYPGAEIYGHHDFNKWKACPSFDARNEYKDL